MTIGLNMLSRSLQLSVSILAILTLFIQCVPSKGGVTNTSDLEVADTTIQLTDTLGNDTSQIVKKELKPDTSAVEQVSSASLRDTIAAEETASIIKAKDTITAVVDTQTVKATFLEVVDAKIKKEGHYGCTRDYKGVKYDVFFLDLRQANLAIHWKDNLDQAYTNIRNLKKDLEKQNKKMLFATNGGIYSTEHTPEGLYIEKSKELKPLNTKNGYGNFYMKPNGIFYLANDKTNKNQIAGIVETKKFNKTKDELSANGYTIIYAVQSGPMLSIEGEKHPAFNKGSSSKRIRNGVGVSNSKRVVFAIPQRPVNFFDFYSFFKEVVKCDDALYLDGVISKMYIDSPLADRKDLNGNFVTIFSVTDK